MGLDRRRLILPSLLTAAAPNPVLLGPILDDYAICKDKE